MTGQRTVCAPYFPALTKLWLRAEFSLLRVTAKTVSALINKLQLLTAEEGSLVSIFIKASVQFKTDGIYALGNALHPVSPHNGFPNVAFKTVPMFAWLTMAFSVSPFREDRQSSSSSFHASQGSSRRCDGVMSLANLYPQVVSQAPQHLHRLHKVTSWPPSESTGEKEKENTTTTTNSIRKHWRKRKNNNKQTTHTHKKKKCKRKMVA